MEDHNGRADAEGFAGHRESVEECEDDGSEGGEGEEEEGEEDCLVKEYVEEMCLHSPFPFPTHDSPVFRYCPFHHMHIFDVADWRYHISASQASPFKKMSCQSAALSRQSQPRKQQTSNLGTHAFDQPFVGIVLIGIGVQNEIQAAVVDNTSVLSVLVVGVTGVESVVVHVPAVYKDNVNKDP